MLQARQNCMPELTNMGQGAVSVRPSLGLVLKRPFEIHPLPRHDPPLPLRAPSHDTQTGGPILPDEELLAQLLFRHFGGLTICVPGRPIEKMPKLTRRKLLTWGETHGVPGKGAERLRVEWYKRQLLSPAGALVFGRAYRGELNCSWHYNLARPLDSCCRRKKHGGAVLSLDPQSRRRPCNWRPAPQGCRRYPITV